MTSRAGVDAGGTTDEPRPRMLLETRIPVAYVVRKIWREAINVVVIAAAIDVVVELNRRVLPPIQGAIPAFLGAAISLLLSFQLNHSYDRWWEARKVWGAIVNDSRTLVRQALTFPTQDTGIARRIARRQAAWCYALAQSLRGLDWRVGTEGLLSEEEREEAEAHANKPLVLAQMQARDVRALAEKGLVTDFQRVALDDTLTRLVDSMGKAERIKSTVFPSTYRIFLHMLIYIFIVILAIALAEVEGLWSIAITAVIAIPMLLLEKTARHMQNPFANRPTDTAMTAISRTIEINVRQLVGDEDVPKPAEPAGYYLM